MKKTLIALGVIILIAAALPIIGNTVIQTKIDTRVKELESYGLKTQNTKTDSSYLTSKQHFEFLLEDADEFISFLNQYADNQIPPYVNAMLEGVVLGADLEYSNLPFSKDITLDIYLLNMSKTLAKSLEADDKVFYDYLAKFLQAKGVLYHINYNIVSEDFSGFIKDIKEVYTLEDGTVVKLNLQDTKFDGNGEIIAPNRLTTQLKKFKLKIENKKEFILLNLQNLEISRTYESKSTHVSSFEIADLIFSSNFSKTDAEFLMKGIKVNASSNTLGEFAELESKSNIELVSLNSKELSFDMKNFNMDLALNSLDKDSFHNTLELVSKIKNFNDYKLQKELEESLQTLISKGFVFNMADFSVENVTLNENEKLNGLKLQSQIKLKADKDFVSKLKTSPLLLLSNIEVSSKIRISREIFAKIVQDGSVSEMLYDFMKEDGNDYISDINLVDGITKVNGKVFGE